MLTKVIVTFWNDTYYGSLTMPDGSTVELKSPEDLSFKGWDEMAAKHWADTTGTPEPPKNVLLPEASVEDLAKAIKERKLTAKDLDAVVAEVKVG
jgi:hypothetical protein